MLKKMSSTRLIALSQSPPAVAGDEPQGAPDEHRGADGGHGDVERDARAVDDAAQHVATEAIGAEEGLAARRGLDQLEVLLVGRLRGEGAREEGHDDDQEREERPRHHHAAVESAPELPAPWRPEPGDGHAAHAFGDDLRGETSRERRGVSISPGGILRSAVASRTPCAQVLHGVPASRRRARASVARR